MSSPSIKYTVFHCTKSVRVRLQKKKGGVSSLGPDPRPHAHERLDRVLRVEHEVGVKDDGLGREQEEDR